MVGPYKVKTPPPVVEAFLLGEIYFLAGLVAIGFAALVVIGFAALVVASFFCVEEFSEDSCFAVPSAAAVGFAIGALVAAKLAVVPPTSVPATTRANMALFIFKPFGWLGAN
jgi:hypothetical protein